MDQANSTVIATQACRYLTSKAGTGWDPLPSRDSGSDHVRLPRSPQATLRSSGNERAPATCRVASANAIFRGRWIASSEPPASLAPWPETLVLPYAEIPFEILPQPDDTTCGPTCLQAVYGYLGAPLPLSRVIAEVKSVTGGGTLGVYLGIHALERGFDATLYTFNLEVFDPTWFDGSGVDLRDRLESRRRARGQDSRLREAVEAYTAFLDLGGVVRFQELRPELFRTHLVEGRPILTGLSATYLYGCAREVDRNGRLEFDDVAGDPTGHFVVVHGYDPGSDSALVADPLRTNPHGTHNYRVGILRLLGAVLLGVLTYDGNLLVVTDPKANR